MSEVTATSTPTMLVGRFIVSFLAVDGTRAVSSSYSVFDNREDDNSQSKDLWSASELLFNPLLACKRISEYRVNAAWSSGEFFSVAVKLKSCAFKLRTVFVVV